MINLVTDYIEQQYCGYKCKLYSIIRTDCIYKIDRIM